ncbi:MULTISPECIES: zinc ribbon domain-containing protein [Gemmiger]|uniref:zinc ribbon domain-containing protein n=1 Tax=Eubacteriales TaxID=186802 RepID=UPI001C02711E|nr:zinc ribbon domain-containing protein [Gemmiger formicilis]MBT9675384.1 zinc-ribbon domain-containing protein [Gemmiger formicilis]
MICVHCGRDIPNGTKFCPFCGQPVAADQPAGQPAFNIQPGASVRPPQQPPVMGAQQPMGGQSAAATATVTPKAPIDPKKLAVPVAVAAVVVVGGVLIATHKPTVNLNKYITLSAEGYNSIGTLDVEFDTDKLEKDYGKKIAKNFQKAMKNHEEDTYGLSNLAGSLYEGGETSLFVTYCADGSADKTRNLSNGDVVTYTWDGVNEQTKKEAEELFGVKIKCSDVTYKVSGLTAVNTFDAFDGVEVEFDGISPDGSATVNTLPTAEAAKSLYYTLDEQYNLANGDTVTVTVHSNRDDFSDCIEKYGAIPAATEKTYTVEGLKEYITSTDGLTDSVLVSLQNQAEDVLNAYIAKSWDSECVTLKGMSYLGYYILTPKNKDNYGVYQDVIILPYQVTSHNHFEDDKGQVYDADVSYYWYIAFRNVSKDADGNIAGGLDDYYTANASFDVKTGLDDGWWEKYWSYDGYQTLDELYSNAVTRNVEDYNHQDNVG